MPSLRLVTKQLGVENTVIEDVWIEKEHDQLIVGVRLRVRWKNRCGLCCRKAQSYDRGHRRRWRHLDFGLVMVFLEADAPRVLDQQLAWLVTKCSKSAVSQLTRVSWRSVGATL